MAQLAEALTKQGDEERFYNIRCFGNRPAVTFGAETSIPPISHRTKAAMLALMSQAMMGMNRQAMMSISRCSTNGSSCH
jgi:hypothetical protein